MPRERSLQAVAPGAAANLQESFLPKGTIQLYRVGTYTPELVFEANVATPVPAGQWTWIAEAPGYVSSSTGLLHVVGATGEPEARKIVWTVVPSCDVDLSGDDWSGVTRFDTVSLDAGATYPVDPRRRQRLQVPAGPIIGYAVGARGLLGLTNIGPCPAGETLQLPRPFPPAGAREDWMIHVSLAEAGGEPPDAGPLRIGLSVICSGKSVMASRACLASRSVWRICSRP